MNKQKDKTVFVTALILVLTLSAFSALIASSPLAGAHVPAWNVPTWTYVSVSPTTIGVGQPALVVFWLNAVPPTAQGTFGDRWKFTLEISKPDGTKITQGPYTSDPVGNCYVAYVPDQTGTYTFVAVFPGQKVTGLPLNPAYSVDAQQGAASVNDTYTASTSASVTLTVQTTPISQYQETPLPTGTWTRPIYGANRQWGSISGNWLSAGDTGPGAPGTGPTTRINPYTTGPESAHILWTRPYWLGGLMGGQYGDFSYYTGMSYEQFGLVPPIILNGKLYYNVQTPPRYGWYCIDLRTGVEEFFHNTTGPIVGITYSGFDDSGSIRFEQLAFGQIYDYESPNQHGGFGYLWSVDPLANDRSMAVGAGTTWRMFDAYTGNFICSISNVTQTEVRGTSRITTGATGTSVYGKEGSILRYNIVNFGNTTLPNMYLQVWNTSRALWVRNWTTNTYWMWRPYLNMTFDGRSGFSMNASIPAVQGSIRAIREDQYVIGGTAGTNNEDVTTKGNLWALNLKPDTNGVINPTLLWNITFTPPSSAGNLSISMGTVDPEDGVFLFSCTQTRQWWAYSLQTGQLLWGPSAKLEQWNFYGMSSTIYKGTLFSYGYGGVLHAFNINTGKEMWNWTSGSVGFETPYGNAPLSIGVVADGKLYLYSTEHSPTVPLRRDAFLWCVNATDGKLLWKNQCWVNSPVIADGYIVTLDSFDNQIYCYGMGPSATTLTVRNDVITKGSTTLITGTVTDQSPGAKGTPAISDADQEAWMEYMYQQRPMPTNVKGVSVHVTAIDPNGNYQDIGKTNSDLNGNFGITWVPPVEGKYQITATFEGTKSYGSSSSSTYLAVTPAALPAVNPTSAPTQTVTPSSTPAQTTVPSSSPSQAPQPTSAMPTTTYIAIAAAFVIIIVAAIAIILRRRK